MGYTEQRSHDRAGSPGRRRRWILAAASLPLLLSGCGILGFGDDDPPPATSVRTRYPPPHTVRTTTVTRPGDPAQLPIASPPAEVEAASAPRPGQPPPQQPPPDRPPPGPADDATPPGTVAATPPPSPGRRPPGRPPPDEAGGPAAEPAPPGGPEVAATAADPTNPTVPDRFGFDGERYLSLVTPEEMDVLRLRSRGDAATHLSRFLTERERENLRRRAAELTEIGAGPLQIGE